MTSNISPIQTQDDSSTENAPLVHALFGEDEQRAEFELLVGEHGDEGAPAGYHPIFYTVLFRC